MANPKVSIIIPCHNQAATLRGAVESAVLQSYADKEIVLVDDASTDETPALMRQLIEEHPWFNIRRVTIRQNVGLSRARNAGIREAKGEYVLPLDSDDLLHPGFLEATVPLMEQVDIVSTDRLNFGAALDIIPGGPAIPQLLPLVNQLPYCSLYKKAVWTKVGGYRRNFPCQGYEDWEFWLDAFICGFKFGHVDKVLWYYRVRPGGMADRAMMNHEFLMARMIDRHAGLYEPDTVARAQEWWNRGPIE